VRVSELMQSEVESIPPDAVAADVMATLAESRISALPVMDSTGRLLGVVSTTDILALEEETPNERARASALQRTRAADLMTPEPLTISPHAEVSEAAARMLEAEVHHLFVTEHDRVVGVISTTDIVRAVATGLLSAAQAPPIQEA
jgi:CBS-domain-containing membrane protein